MTTEMTSTVVGTGSAVGISLVALPLPNPIAAAIYALIAAVVGWATTWILNAIKKRLGL